MSELFSRESTGGAVARNGMEYQDAYALANLPVWISQDGFAGLVSERLGDIEVGYFSVPAQRQLCIEAKNYILTQPEFWLEIGRFEALYAKNPKIYTRFRYVAPGTPTALEPMRSKLERLRGVGATYSPNDPILVEAREEFVQWVLRHTSQTEARAKFVLDHVEFDNFDDSKAEDIFVGCFSKTLPALEDVATGRIRKIASRCIELIAKSVKGHVSRAEIEHAFFQELNLEERKLWLSQPSSPILQCGLVGEQVPGVLDLAIDLRSYVDASRADRTPDEWAALYKDSELMGEFLSTSRSRNRIKLNSNLRMSAAVAMGAAFRATKKHALVMEHRGSEFALDDFRERGAAYFQVDQVPDTGIEGFVAIQIGVPTRPDIVRAMAELGHASAPKLFIESADGLPDIAALNTAIKEAKHAITGFRSTMGLRKIHLIIKGPSFFAMALGHRLNGIGSVQLYDWVGDKYIATILIESA